MLFHVVISTKALPKLHENFKGTPLIIHSHYHKKKSSKLLTLNVNKYLTFNLFHSIASDIYILQEINGLVTPVKMAKVVNPKKVLAAACMNN